MANIDNLNFKVILDDTGFQTQINKNIAEANRLNKALTQALNVKVSSKQIVTDKGLSNARQMSGILDEIAQKIRTMPKGKFLVGDADRLNATLEQTNKKLDQIIAKTQEAGKSATGLNRAWLRFTATFWSIISIVRIFTRTLGAAIKNISSFQQANANLATIMQVSRKEIEVLTNDALMLGRTTEWTASQVTELQTALAKLGYNIPQIRNMQESVLQFATSVSADLTDAANLAGSALRMFGMHSTETQKALEILTASTNKTALDFEKLKVALPYAGAIAHSIGFDVAETASLLGVLANSGLAASRSGTGLRQILIELSQQNGKLQQAMGGNIRTFDDFVNGLQRLRDSGMEAGEAANLVQKRAAAALLILANGVDDIRRLNKEVRDTDGLLENIQKDRLNTLHGATLLLKSAWEGLIQTFRDSAGPMRDVVRLLTKIINATSLAASRANRVAQGTKHIVGSDALTEQWNDKFDSLLKSGKSPEEATRIVQEDMQKYLSGAYQTLAGWQQKGYKETPFRNFLYKNPVTHFFAYKTKNGRIANEQVEAVENSIDAVNDYMKNRAAEEAEIAANAYLEEWKAVFDTKGEKAAREAMSKVAGFDDMKTRMEAYIANGGLEGAEDRGKGKDTKSDPLADARQQIRAEISLLEKLKSIYDRREAVFGKDAAASWVLENMGYNVKNLDADLESLIAKLRDLGDAESVAAAESIEASLGLDQTSKDIKAFNEKAKALEKYQNTLKKWQKDFGGRYTGFDAELDKIVVGYNNEIKTIDDEYIQQLELLKEAHGGNAEAMMEESLALHRLYRARKTAAYGRADAALGELAKKHVKDATSGLNLTDWGDKSLGQIYGLYKILGQFAEGSLTGDVSISEGVAKELKEAGLSIEDFSKLSYDAFRKLSENAKEELLKKLASTIKEMAQDFKEAASSVKEFSDEAGDVELSESIAELSNFAELASGVFQKVAQGNYIGAAMSVVTWYVKTIFAARTEAKKLEATLASLREGARMTSMRDFLSNGADGVFGTNSMRGVENAAKLMSDLRQSMKEYSKDISSMRFYGRKLGMFEWATPNQKFKYETIQSMADAVGGDLYDAYGNLNATTLQSILDTYENLDAAQREWIEHAITDSTMYAEAVEQVQSTLESVFGDIASSAADNIIDQWVEAGNAALDYADILDDVARRYAKMLIESAILDQVLNKEEADKVANMFVNGNAEGAMAAIAGDMEKIAGMEPLFSQILTAFDPYFNRADSSSSGSGSLGSGIKSITEDTANLLASYINAIRADVSYIRVMQEKGWGAIENLGGALPTLQDYLAQCAGNTYDLAVSNQSILSELQSVIGAPGTSGMVVRVESA